MIKRKKLLSRLIISNFVAATVALIVFLQVPSRNLAFCKIAWSIALFYGGFAILTVLQYKDLSNKIENGERKESDFYFWWERKKLKKELSQEEHSEESDTNES